MWLRGERGDAQRESRLGIRSRPINDILVKQEGHGEADWQAGWLKEVSDAVMKRYLEAKAGGQGF
jgi:hypothetical protein